ncbi:MAG: MBL fold metallo-hydrolase [Magnetococcales bacterium]|nr:MBL fold metallo-hydrolase [Magnetococcales bacterium]
MRRSLFFITLCLFLFRVPAALAELSKLADNVYAYVGVKDASPAHSFAANAGIVIGRDGVLVIDTLISAKEGERFLADIRAITDKPILYVVNTHTHLDHALGNCVFAKLGAHIIAHEEDQTLLAQRGADILKNAAVYGLQPEDMVGTEIVLPSIAFSQYLTINLGNSSVRLMRNQPSHTQGSLVVYLPQEKILFSGDILFTDFHPFLADGDLPGWSKTLDDLMQLDVDKIVPGHGPLSSKKDLQEMQQYLSLFDSQAKAILAQHADTAAASASLLQQLPKRSMAEWMVEFNLKSRYLANK